MASVIWPMRPRSSLLQMELRHDLMNTPMGLACERPKLASVIISPPWYVAIRSLGTLPAISARIRVSGARTVSKIDRADHNG